MEGGIREPVPNVGEYTTRATALEWGKKIPILFFLTSLHFQCVSVCFLIHIIYLSSNILMQYNDCITGPNSLYLPVSKLFAYNFAVLSYSEWANLLFPLTLSLAL